MHPSHSHPYKSTQTSLTRRKFLNLSTVYTSTLLLAPHLACNTDDLHVRFGLLADSHYADRDPLNTRFYRQALDKMEEAVEIMNQEKVDFLVHLGDFKDEGPNKDETETLGFLQTIEHAFTQFQGPVFHCIGNHDVDSIRKETFLQHISNTGIPKDKSYFSFDLKGMHFVVLDANYHKDDRDQFYLEGADWQDPNIPQAQLDWLSQDLDNTQLPCVVFCHHPLFEFRRNEHQYHVNNYLKVQKILEASGKVMAVFQGHVHAEQHTQIKGIHYLTQLAMVDHEGLENNSYAIVEIQQKQIQIHGYKRVSDQQY